MRVRMTAEKELIQRLEATFKAGDTIKAEPYTEAQDRTELEFGIAEVVAIVAVVKSTAELMKILVEIARTGKPTKTQRVQLKSAFGTVTIDLQPDITVAELQQMLKALAHE